MPITLSDFIDFPFNGGKGVRASQLDGPLAWRPIFYVLGNVGSRPTNNSHLKLATLQNGNPVSRGTLHQGIPGDSRGADFQVDTMVIDVVRVLNDGTEIELDGVKARFRPPQSLADDEKLYMAWVKTPVTLPDDTPDYDIFGLVELAGGYHAEAAHAINQLTPLIEQEFGGTTGTDTGEVQVAGVSIENSQAVAYAIRVGAATEYALGATLHALRSNAPLEIGIANFYSKAGDDAGKLYHTLDEATDGALEIWKVNDLAAIRAILAALGGGETFTAALKAKLEGLNDAVIDLLEPLEGDGLSVGDVVLSDRKFHRYATPGIANAFAGVLGTYREAQTYYLVTSRSDSHFGAHGRFTDNHDAAIGAVLVGQGTNNVMEVQIDKAAYETAKGSAVASGDQISAAFTGTVSGSETTTTHVLPYVRSFTVGGKTWLSFEGQAPNSVPKRVGTHPDGWSLIVSQGGSVLLTHAVDDSHFTEYPIEGIDQAARDAANAAAGATNVRDALQTLTGDARLDASAVKDLPQPVAGLAGLRTESISFQEDVAESPGDELSPLAQDPVAVVHGDGDPEMLTGLSGNDFTVAPGLYFIQATGNQDGAGIGHFALQFRQSSDNAVIAAMPNVFFYNTGEQPFTASAYWHVTEAVEVNLFLARFDSRAVGVADLVVSFARLTAEDTADRHVIEPLEPLDTDEANDGEVVLSEHEFYVRQPGHGTANTFAGELERWTDGADTWLGTAIRNSVYGQRGQFSSNPDSNVGVLLAGISTDDADTVDLWIRKAAYDAAVGRAANSGDTVKAVITADVDGTATTTTTELTYAVFHGDSGYYSFSAIDPNNVLHNLADGATWSMVVNRANDNPLLTHAAGAPHFVEYPIRGAIDQYARDTLGDMGAFLEAVKSWEFVEPAGGIGFREVGDFAGQARDEAITGELDPDRELVAALRITEEYELTRTLRLQCTIGYFLRKTSHLTTSGAIGSVQVSLAVQRSGASTRVLRQLHAATFTLDQFNAQYAAVSNALQYSDSADVTHAVDESWMDFSNFDLKKGDLLVFHFRANAINGNARVKIEMQDLDITLSNAL